MTDEQIIAFEGISPIEQAKFYFDRRNADGRTHRDMVAALLSASKPAAPLGKEAERYRWLRDRSNDIEWPIGAGWGELGEAEGQEFDVIVDNAMRASNGT